MAILNKPKEGWKELIAFTVGMALLTAGSKIMSPEYFPHFVTGVEYLVGFIVFGRVGAKAFLWGSQAAAIRGEAKAAAAAGNLPEKP